MENNYLALEERAQPGSFSQYDIEILAKEFEKLPDESVYLEIGVHKGRSLSVANMLSHGKKIRLYGVDVLKQPELEIYLSDNPHLTFYWGDSVFLSEVWTYLVGRKINLLLIDGDHTYLGVKRDIDAWLPHMIEGGTILFHDCDESSPGVQQAVFELAAKTDIQPQGFKTKDKNTSIAKIQL